MYSSICERNIIVTVDGVSSTSPEPKPETVRKVSPDPGVGLPPIEENALKIMSEPTVSASGMYSLFLTFLI